jgi:hypothetical protein
MKPTDIGWTRLNPTSKNPIITMSLSWFRVSVAFFSGEGGLR